MKKIISFILFSTLLLMTTACSVEENNDVVSLEKSNKLLIQQLSDISSASELNGFSKSGKLPQPPIWADCYVYSGLVVPASFKPNSDSFDELYVMPEGMFKNGVPLISDSKPGDQDYNGGRWHLNVLKEGIDPAKYANACKEEHIDPNDFDSTDMYFECPLRPFKN